ncbi:DUF3152 domain-containing protein [Streptomyces sp. NPDC001984]
MGRHSRRGPAAKGDAAEITAGRGAQDSGVPKAQAAPGAMRAGRPGETPGPVDGRPGSLPGQRPSPVAGPSPVGGGPGFRDGTPARGVPRFADGTPARGVPRPPDGTPARGVPRFADGTPARGVPRLPDGTPARGVPRLPDGTPARGIPQARGEHPEVRETGGGRGEFRGRAGVVPGSGAGPGVALPRQRRAGMPRQDYIDAFDAGDADGSGGSDDDIDVFAPRPKIGAQRVESYGPDAAPATDETGADEDVPPTSVPVQAKGGKGRAFTGMAAAAVTTVLTVIVAGHVTDEHDGTDVRAQSANDQGRDTHGSASRGDGRTTPSAAPGAVTLTYDQKMAEKYALGPKLKGSGKFDAVPGTARAPGNGRKYTYRVDVERGLGLDGELFAQAVQKTLNDRRSWAHDGARTFERVDSGKPDFVITLASPGTTADWCAKSGLDTTEDNVSCDSASTERVMINAYRWAQGAKTYGDEIHAYRQMLINHEVGHRLGYGHVTCEKDGGLAPVMQQQTKFLDHDGIHCLPNPWPYPGS